MPARRRSLRPTWASRIRAIRRSTRSTVRFNSLPTSGTLKIGGSNVNPGQVYTDSPAAHSTPVPWSIRPAVDFAGNDSLTFQVQDNGTPGVALATIANTFTFNVTNVVDPPQGANGSVTPTVLSSFENVAGSTNSHVFNASEFGFTDPHDLAPNNNNFTGAALRHAAHRGARHADQRRQPGQHDDSGLAGRDPSRSGPPLFTPALNSTTTASFTFKVQDSGPAGSNEDTTSHDPGHDQPGQLSEHVQRPGPHDCRKRLVSVPAGRREYRLACGRIRLQRSRQ